MILFTIYPRTWKYWKVPGTSPKPLKFSIDDFRNLGLIGTTNKLRHPWIKNRQSCQTMLGIYPNGPFYIKVMGLYLILHLFIGNLQNVTRCPRRRHPWMPRVAWCRRRILRRVYLLLRACGPNEETTNESLRKLHEQIPL